MKKLVVLVLAFVFLGSATVSAQEASSLQNQSSSSVQGNGSSVQNTSTQTPQGIDSLNKLSTGGTNVPLSSSTTTTQTSAPTEESGSSIVQNVLVGLVVLGIFIVGLVVWGATDKRRVQEEATTEKVVVPKPKTKKKPKSKRKKAHR